MRPTDATQSAPTGPAPRRPLGRALRGLGVLALLAVCFPFDRWFFVSVSLRLNTRNEFDTDFYHATLPLWDLARFYPHLVGIGLAGLAIALLRPHGPRRAAIALAAVLLAGGVANLAQDAIGRLRPNQADNAWTFRPFWTSATPAPAGLPSGEAATAFALSAMLSRQFRRYRLLFLVLAIWVAAARALPGMHYPSDVVAGALVGWLLARGATWLLLRGLRRVRRRKPATVVESGSGRS